MSQRPAKSQLRQVLLALVCLSTFALAQNGSAIVTLPVEPAAGSLAIEPALWTAEGLVAASGSELEPAPRELAAAMLLFAGLAGLSLVGNRPRNRARGAL